MKEVLLANQVLKLMVGMLLKMFSFVIGKLYIVTVWCGLLNWFFVILRKILDWGALLAFPHKFWSYLFRYTFCGLAAMILIGEVKRLDLPSLIVRSHYLSWDYVWAFISSFLRWLFPCSNMVSLFPMVYLVRCFSSVLIVGTWSIIITLPINFTLALATVEYGYIV